MLMKLSEAEQTAIDLLRSSGGSILISRIPDTNQNDEGFIVPGMGVYRKLEKKGLVVICEPIVEEDGFEWTPAVELIDQP